MRFSKRNLVLLFYIILSVQSLFSLAVDDKNKRRVLQQASTSSQVKNAGFFTPYNIIPGGGERYFLTSILAFQKMGYEVDILKQQDNTCDSIEKLKKTASFLRVDLDFNRLRLVNVRVNKDQLLDVPSDIVYEVFYVLGNDKIPQIQGYGKKVNYYMCQFPFDYNDVSSDDDLLKRRLHSFTTYDMILVNSFFTSMWYEKATIGFYRTLMSKTDKVPSVEILHPPVEPFILDEQQSNLRATDPEIHISLLGRFFVGRQSKGQNIALNILYEILKITDKKIVLNLIGAISPEQEHQDFVAELKKNATSLNLPVNFLTSVSPDIIAKTLSRSMIQWHLTGIHEDKNHGDPASLEHFGISVVEGMSAGCIPIVLNRGGTVDIVQDGMNGFVVDTAADFVKKTIFLFTISADEIIKMRESARERAKVFHLDKFISKISFIHNRELKSYDYHKVAQNHLKYLVSQEKPKQLKSNSELTAVMIEPFINSQFEISVRSVLRFLDEDWALQIHHTRANKLFVRIRFNTITDIQYVHLPNYMQNTRSIDRLLKSKQFWLSLNTGYALIFDSNTVMLRPGITEFKQFDYIGAHWGTLNDESILGSDAKNSLISHTGNGAFTFRNVKAVIDVIDRFGIVEIPEYLYFTKSLVQLGYKVATPVEAYNFSREIFIGDYNENFFHDLPLGFHALWLHNTNVAINLLDASMKKYADFSYD